ncbi:hypothetical protein UMZ34_00955 [Halopseudomonas pachastrellae]|nr:hypothetical protein UMZ34_00955 [Halopseudomonas pachastrellae]
MMPEAVLNKPGRLTDEEYDIMRQHPMEGYKLLQELAGRTPGRSGCVPASP